MLIKVTFRMDTNESAVTYFETEEEAMEFVMDQPARSWRIGYLFN